MNERGNASVVALAVIAVALFSGARLTELGAAALARARADRSADLAALAGASALASGSSPNDAVRAIAANARANDARVVAARISTDRVDVECVVAVATTVATARSAAVVD